MSDLLAVGVLLVGCFFAGRWSRGWRPWPSSPWALESSTRRLVADLRGHVDAETLEADLSDVERVLNRPA